MFFCDKCQGWKSLAHSSGNLHKHLRKVHPDEWTAKVTRTGKEKSIDWAGLSDEQRKAHITEYIVECCESFRKVEAPSFRKMTGVVMNRKEVKGRIMVLRDQLWRKIVKMLQKVSDLVISFDEWSDAKHNNYLGVRGYMVFEKRYVNVCLEHIHLTNNDTAAADLVSLLEKILGTKYQVEQKVHYGITDNASVMIAATDALKLIRMPCFCHVLNLMVHDFIEKINIDELLSFLNSFARSSRFTGYLEKKKAMYKSIPTFSPTRWFSLANAVRNCIADKAEIIQFISKERRKRKPFSMQISDATWEAVEKLHKILQQFRYVCQRLEGDEFGSLSNVWLSFALLQDRCHKDSSLKEAWDVAVRTHWSKFVTHEVRATVALASVLNPSIPLSVIPPDDLSDANRTLAREIAVRSPRHGKGGKLEKGAKGGSHNSDILITFDEFVNSEGSQQSELDTFMGLNRGAIFVSERKFGRNGFDVMQWWNGNGQTYPTLFALAMKYLAIPASSAAAERQFSHAKNVQSIRRQSLGTSTFAALVYVTENRKLLSDDSFVVSLDQAILDQLDRQREDQVDAQYDRQRTHLDSIEHLFDSTLDSHNQSSETEDSD
jgi:hypothetical protein